MAPLITGHWVLCSSSGSSSTPACPALPCQTAEPRDHRAGGPWRAGSWPVWLQAGRGPRWAAEKCWGLSCSDELWLSERPGGSGHTVQEGLWPETWACRPWAHAWGQCREVHTSPGSLHTPSCWATVASRPRQALAGQWWRAGARFSASWDEVPADSPGVWSPDLGPLNLFRATALRKRLPQRAAGLSPPDPSWKAGALLRRGAAPVF